MTMVPWFTRGIAYAERSLAIRRDLGDLWGQGQSLNFYGVVLYAVLPSPGGDRAMQEAIRLLDQTGDRWEVNTAAWNIAFARYRLGELGRGPGGGGRPLRRRHRHRRRHRGRGEPERVVPGVSRSGARRPGAGPAEGAQRRRPHRGRGPRGRGRAPPRPGKLGSGRGGVGGRGRHRPPGGTAPGIRGAGAAVAGHRPAQSGRGHVALPGHAAPGPVAAGSPNGPAGWSVARFYENNTPHALRERGLVASLQGHDRRARRFLHRSLAAAEAQGARYELLSPASPWPAPTTRPTPR